MSNIPDGQVLVPGRSRETAAALLKVAGDDAASVRTSAEGYLVPEKVAKAYEASLKKSSAKKADEPPATEPVDVDDVEDEAPAKKPAPKKKS